MSNCMQEELFVNAAEDGKATVVVAAKVVR